MAHVGFPVGDFYRDRRAHGGAGDDRCVSDMESGGLCLADDLVERGLVGGGGSPAGASFRPRASHGPWDRIVAQDRQPFRCLARARIRSADGSLAREALRPKACWSFGVQAQARRQLVPVPITSALRPDSPSGAAVNGGAAETAAAGRCCCRSWRSIASA